MVRQVGRLLRPKCEGRIRRVLWWAALCVWGILGETSMPVQEFIRDRLLTHHMTQQKHGYSI